MSTPTFEDACRACDYASTHGTNFIASFRALAAICRDIGQEAVASKAKDLLRLILCSAPLCCTAKHTKVVRSVAICVLESGPAASALLATGLIKGSSIYAHKFNPRACCLVIRTHSLSIISFAGRALFLHLRLDALLFLSFSHTPLISWQLPSPRLHICSRCFCGTRKPRSFPGAQFTSYHLRSGATINLY
jgi:hypothetical protein